MSEKRIITAALTGGIHTPSMSPHLPITPEALIEEAVRAHEAGAAVAHVHVRNPQTGLPSADQDMFRTVAEGVMKRCDMVICCTTGGSIGQSVEDRVRVVTSLSPELASLNAGSLNFSLFPIVDSIQSWTHDWEKSYLQASEDFIFPNTFRTMRQFLEIFAVQGTKPEFEIYDVGMINNVAFLIEKGHVRKPVYLQFVMGILGGIPATIENFVFLLESARKALGDFQFSVCAAGKAEFSLCTTSLMMGGHARVGLEDNLYLEKGRLAKSNAEQVAKIARIAREFGIEPATPAEARQILGLKGMDKVKFSAAPATR